MADKNNFLKFDFGLNKMSKKPSKRRMNFADDGKRDNSKFVLIAVVAVLLLVFGLVLKFGVIDLYSDLSDLELQQSAIQEQVMSKNRMINSLDNMSEDYAHYVYPDYSDEELARVDRKDVVDMINKYIKNKSEILEWSLYGNELTIKLENSTFNKANLIIRNMQKESIVNYGFVSFAEGKSEDEKPGDDVRIRQGDKIEDVGASHKDKSVVLTIYLNVPKEEFTAGPMSSGLNLPTASPSPVTTGKPVMSTSPASGAGQTTAASPAVAGSPASSESSAVAANPSGSAGAVHSSNTKKSAKQKRKNAANSKKKAKRKNKASAKKSAKNKTKQSYTPVTSYWSAVRAAQIAKQKRIAKAKKKARQKRAARARKRAKKKRAARARKKAKQKEAKKKKNSSPSAAASPSAGVSPSVSPKQSSAPNQTSAPMQSKSLMHSKSLMLSEPTLINFIKGGFAHVK